MTATPSMTPKTSVTGVLLACAGAATLALLLQTVNLPEIGGWRSTNAAPAPMTVSATTRATHSLGGDAAVSVGDAITTRARN